MRPSVRHVMAPTFCITPDYRTRIKDGTITFMKIVTLRLVSVLILLATAVWAADVSGTWKGDLSTPDGSTFSLVYTLKQDGGKLTGTVLGPEGTPVDLANGKVDGDKLSFSVHIDMNGGMTFVSEGTVKGDEITLITREEGADQAFPPVTLKREKG